MAEKDTRAEALKESQERVADETKEQAKRTTKARPTPTQAENDAAAMGFATVEELDEKEPDGSEEEEAAPASKAMSAGSGTGYKTRGADKP